MKIAEVYCETVSGADYVWKWRDRERVSPPFRTCFECVEDARRNGYNVQVPGARGATKSGAT